MQNVPEVPATWADHLSPAQKVKMGNLGKTARSLTKTNSGRRYNMKIAKVQNHESHRRKFIVQWTFCV